jgi:hypothetical protein
VVLSSLSSPEGGQIVLFLLCLQELLGLLSLWRFTSGWHYDLLSLHRPGFVLVRYYNDKPQKIANRNSIPLRTTVRIPGLFGVYENASEPNYSIVLVCQGERCFSVCLRASFRDIWMQRTSVHFLSGLLSQYAPTWIPENYFKMFPAYGMILIFLFQGVVCCYSNFFSFVSRSKWWNQFSLPVRIFNKTSPTFATFPWSKGVTVCRSAVRETDDKFSGIPCHHFLHGILPNKFRYNFLPLGKSYDSVKREVLYNILIKFGVPMKPVKPIS